MNLIQALRLAAWVNSHDGGTEQPRAIVSVADLDEEDTFVVSIRSTEILVTGAHHVVVEIAPNVEKARAILGY